MRVSGSRRKRHCCRPEPGSFPFRNPAEWNMNVKSLSRVRLFATPWTVVYQAPLSWDFPGNSTGVDCHFLLQGIFPTQGSNPSLPHRRQMLYRLRSQPKGREAIREEEISSQPVWRSNQSILKINPGCSLEGLMLKLKLQYFGHLMGKADS